MRFVIRSRWLAVLFLVAAAGLSLGQNCAGPSSSNVPIASACGLHAAYCVEVVGKSPLAIAAGAFNVAGRPDVAVANFGTDNVELLFNDGSGGLESAGKYKVGDSPGAIVAGDFDADGDLDLAASDGLGVAVLTNRGDGQFNSAVRLTLDQQINAFPVSLVAADLNGDGARDLAAAGIGWTIDFIAGTAANADNVSVLLNDGRGVFSLAQTLVLDYPYPRLGDITAGDLSGDGQPDLAVATYTGQVLVLLNQGTAAFSFSSAVDVGTDHVLSGVVAADLNGDGAADLIVADNGDPLDPDNTGGDVAVFFNQGGGSFSPALRIATGNAPTSVAVADFNRDGLPDLAVANNLSDDLSIVLNQGGGAFAPAVNFTTGDGPTSVAAADFDRDGDPDLAVSHMISGVVGVYLNDGTGCFTCDR